MKKIIKEIELLMTIYKRYRLIITNDIIELKLTPKSNYENEINWCVDNDKDGKSKLLFSLHELVSSFSHN